MAVKRPVLSLLRLDIQEMLYRKLFVNKDGVCFDQYLL